jgi:hypothetical protein
MPSLLQLINETKEALKEGDTWDPNSKDIGTMHHAPRLNKAAAAPAAKPCPPGTLRNKVTGACVPLRGAKIP